MNDHQRRSWLIPKFYRRGATSALNVELAVAVDRTKTTVSYGPGSVRARDRLGDSGRDVRTSPSGVLVDVERRLP